MDSLLTRGRHTANELLLKMKISANMLCVGFRKLLAGALCDGGTARAKLAKAACCTMIKRWVVVVGMAHWPVGFVRPDREYFQSILARPHPLTFWDLACRVTGTDYADDRQADVTIVLTRYLAAGIAALAICIAAAPVDGQPQSNAPVISCTNPASGWTWQISIDLDRAMVDSNPARITDAEISWRDTRDGGNYTLDRRSGDLTVVVASSTGGYFLHDHCRVPP